MMQTDRYLRPHWDRSALITIDVQRDTLDGQPLEVPGTSAVLPTIARLRDAFRRARRPIVHVVRLYLPDGSNADTCRRASLEAGAEVLVPGGEGCQLAPGLGLPPAALLNVEHLLAGQPQHIDDLESVIFKPRWGAFYETSLSLQLAASGADTLVFVGCNFPNCPRTSIYEASERDFRIVAVVDGISGLYDVGIEELRGIGVSCSPSHEVAAAVG
jgi:nicotinamidase-related amidase